MNLFQKNYCDFMSCEYHQKKKKQSSEFLNLTKLIYTFYLRSTVLSCDFNLDI